MKLQFSDAAWLDYQRWQQVDRRKAERINVLLKAIVREPHEGIGNPEKLKFEKSGWWSRRIDLEHRLVYRVDGDVVEIASLRYHYLK